MPTALDLAFVTVLAVAWPLYETFIDWPEFQWRSRRNPSAARLFEYRRSMAQQWVLAAVALAIWAHAGRPWTALGLVSPPGWRLWMGFGVVAAFAALQAWQVTAIARSPATRAHLRKRMAEMKLASLLPHDRRELGWMMALSLTAGFVEELLFRGYIVAVLAPWLGWWGAAALGMAAFGVLHAYQGRAGIVRTAILGAVMTLLVAATGWLLPAILLHAVIDVGSGTAAFLALSQPPAEASTA
ncbi:MAG TPA: CPBP family intramembrane glutamic endopeptidase [Longimicrobium sp.]|nr:CPBP family intramembrane glutamic endopeptidase [Longimicrobium sp.]